MVFGATAVTPALRLSGMIMGFAFDIGPGIANSTTALGADGFTVGESTSTNTNARRLPLRELERGARPLRHWLRYRHRGRRPERHRDRFHRPRRWCAQLA